jgi:plastocyanin
MKRASLCIFVISVAAMVSPARAAATVAIAGPAASAVGFATPVVVAATTAPFTFVNGDNGAQHNVESVDFGPDSSAWCVPQHFSRGRCPLFFGPLIDFGKTSTVDGIAGLTPGKTYAFKCELHSPMIGTLVVI